MNKRVVQNILYAGHCLGFCSDWSEKAVNDIIDALKYDDFVYNKTIIHEVATIEERAKELGKKYARQYRHNASWLGEDFVYSNEEIEMGCKEIATDQRKIDIDKACEWLKNNTPIGLMEDELSDFFEDFKKAMEE